jgi:hypothetical protein
MGRSLKLAIRALGRDSEDLDLFLRYMLLGLGIFFWKKTRQAARWLKTKKNVRESRNRPRLLYCIASLSRLTVTAGEFHALRYLKVSSTEVPQ